MKKVYIIFRKPSIDSFYGNEFIAVFFKKDEAEKYIESTRVPLKYFIKAYEDSEQGMAREVFD